MFSLEINYSSIVLEGDLRNMKKLINTSVIYAVLALAGGVFYREFTKFNGFTGYSTLSVVHTHYFILGMFMFLILALLEKNIAFMTKKSERLLFAYQAGLNLTVIMLIVRGVLQIIAQNSLSAGLNASISGIAGIGHLILGIALVMLLLEVKKACPESSK